MTSAMFNLIKYGRFVLMQHIAIGQQIESQSSTIERCKLNVPS